MDSSQQESAMQYMTDVERECERALVYYNYNQEEDAHET